LDLEGNTVRDDASDIQPEEGFGRMPRTRRTWFIGGVVVGLLLGVGGTLVVADLLPESSPDCVRPERVVWSSEGSGVQIDVTYADDGTNGCDAGVVFREPRSR
jgi:hypothetical protein